MQGETIVGDRRRTRSPLLEGTPYRGVERRRRPRLVQRAVWLIATMLGLAIVVSLALAASIPGVAFPMLTPRAQIGVESAASLARLFAALVLFLFPNTAAGQRLRWAAAGFVILGLNSLVFGYLLPVVGASPSFETDLYESLLGRTVAAAVFVVALVPGQAPRFSRRAFVWALIGFTAASIAVLAAHSRLPALLLAGSLSSAAARHNAIIHELTGWHWALSGLSLLLSFAALAGAERQYKERRLGGWMLIAMVLYAGSQLHNTIWPFAYSTVLTTTDMLRFGFSAVIGIAGFLELRRIARERAALLAAQQEEARRLAELNVLKANFTAMVAHELVSPLAAIRGWADILAAGALKPEEHSHGLDVIQSQSQLLSVLVEDVQAAAHAERDDFAVELRPTPLVCLLDDAAAYARTLPGNHPFSMEGETGEVVWADPDRLGQVLRNLLGNAAKYTPNGTPIELRAVRRGAHVRIDVADSGPGIQPDDLQRIFEKFGRGRHGSDGQVKGIGLGLYLSRRIAQAHGSDLRVQSTPGQGAVFSFDLREVS